MPGFDGTGPASGGEMTGGGRGYCNSSASYGVVRSGSRSGVDFGYGRGRGYRHMLMKENTLKKLELLLLNRRREILKQVAHLEAEREELGQRFIEPIDAAQKEDLLRLVHKLDERGKEEIEEIELAIDKIESGSYGNCELCGKSIPIKRLKVLPATRLCRNCAQKYEEAQKLRKHHRDEIIDDDLLDEYRSLNDENSSIGRVKPPDDKSLLDIEEV